MRVLCFFLFALLTTAGVAKKVPVTFQLDTRDRVWVDSVWSVAGTFQEQLYQVRKNWTPGRNVLSDPDGDGIYTLTLMLDSGYYQYHYINGMSYDDTLELLSPACGVGVPRYDFKARELYTGGTGIQIPPQYFGDCKGLVKFELHFRDGTRGVYPVIEFNDPSLGGYIPKSDSSPVYLPMAFRNYYPNYHDFSCYLKTDSVVGYRFGSSGSIESVPSECADERGFRTLKVDTTALHIKHCYRLCEKDCPRLLGINQKTYWWNERVFYEVFIRSFADSDGDGIGDFKGLISKLDYLNDGDPVTANDLGVNGIKLMPIYPSTSYHGYNPTDLRSVNREYGSMEDFEAFLDEAHQRDIKVMIDFVLNHTSDQHPWFLESGKQSGSIYDSFYIWRDDKPYDKGPDGQEVWHPYNNKYYYGIKGPDHPDLNLDHPVVLDHLIASARFWVNKGVDGIYLNDVAYLVEDFPKLEHVERSYQLCRNFKIDFENFLLGDVKGSTEVTLPYVSYIRRPEYAANRLDACIENDLATEIIEAVKSENGSKLMDHLRFIQHTYPYIQWGMLLSRNDQKRIYDEFEGDEKKIKLAVSIMLSLPGVPIILYGDEIGMNGSESVEEIRSPMQWNGAEHAGFTSGTPWKAVRSDYQDRNVEQQLNDDNSMLNHYRECIRMRNTESHLWRHFLRGMIQVPDTGLPDGTIAWIRHDLTEEGTWFPSISPLSVLFMANLSNTRKLAEPYWNVSYHGGRAAFFDLRDHVIGFGGGRIDNATGGGSYTYDMDTLMPYSAHFLEMFTFIDHVTETSGVNHEWTIFPNPAQSQLTIVLPKGHSANIQLYNLMGQLIIQQTAVVEQSVLDISAFPAGVYHVLIENDQILSSKKLVIHP